MTGRSETETSALKKRPSKGRAFQCTGYPGCSMSFTRSEHLARHKRKHTGERPFTCPYCSKNFSRLDNLRQHKQTVHAYETFLKGSSVPVLHQDPSTPFYPQMMVSPPNSSSPVDWRYRRYPYQQSQQSQSQPSQPQPQPQINQQMNHPNHNMINPIIPPLNQGGIIGVAPMQMPLNQGLPSLYPFVSAPPSISATPVDSEQLKTPSTFKPKRRPRPLTLQHSHLEHADVQTAPAHCTSFTVGPLPNAPLPSAPMSRGLRPSRTPNLVSPLSPLFHQSFSQRRKVLPGVESILKEGEELARIDERGESKKPTIDSLLSSDERTSNSTSSEAKCTLTQ